MSVWCFCRWIPNKQQYSWGEGERGPNGYCLPNAAVSPSANIFQCPICVPTSKKKKKSLVNPIPRNPQQNWDLRQLVSRLVLPTGGSASCKALRTSPLRCPRARQPFSAGILRKPRLASGLQRPLGQLPSRARAHLVANLPAPFPSFSLTTFSHILLKLDLGAVAVSMSQLSKFGSSAFLFCTGQKKRRQIYFWKKSWWSGRKVGIDLRAFQRLPVVGTGSSQINSPTAPPAGHQLLLISSLELAGEGRRSYSPGTKRLVYSVVPVHLIDKISAPERAESAQERRVGPQTLPAPFTISVAKFPTLLRRGVPCFKKIHPKKQICQHNCFK